MLWSRFGDKVQTIKRTIGASFNSFSTITVAVLKLSLHLVKSSRFCVLSVHLGRNDTNPFEIRLCCMTIPRLYALALGDPNAFLDEMDPSFRACTARVHLCFAPMLVCRDIEQIVLPVSHS